MPADSSTRHRVSQALLACVLAASQGSPAYAASARYGTVAPRPTRLLTTPSGADALVSAAIAGDQARLQYVVAELRLQPRARGDRSRSRQLNERGLALWQRQRFAEAAAVFREAHRVDPGDAEIAENLGYALLKAGNVAAAEPAILEALEIGPERASAWGSLGMIYAKQGRHNDGVACVLTAYRFSQNRGRTLDVYRRLALNDEDSRVRALLADVLRRLDAK